MLAGMTFHPPDAAATRSERTFPALMRLAERHGATPAARARQAHPELPSPGEAVRLTAMLGAGSVPYATGEDAVDAEDLLAALTLVPLARTELDEWELSLLQLARGRGLTWAQVAFGLGLSSAQAAQQRFQRLSAREQDGQELR